MTQINPKSDTQNNKDDYSLEPTINTYVDYTKDAEKVNGRWAMLGFIALLGAYLSTGQIIPGIY